MIMTFRWGILGPGKIAHRFAASLAALDDHRLVAVGSRDAGRAADFARRHGAARAHGSYRALIADEGVDAVYVATPHNYHQDPTIACLEAGKAVLCEKPLAVNGAQVASMIDAARAADCFLMEAMWTRFLPIYAQVRAWLADGAVGEPRQVRASFGFRGSPDPAHRHLNADLAGGALLDVGVYPVTLALWVFGRPPVEVKALGYLGDTGVDEQTGVLLRFDRGELAILDCAVRTVTAHDAYIFGTRGEIRIERFSRATTAHLEYGERRHSETRAFAANGFEYQAAEVARCVREGLIESPVMSHRASVEVMAVMDEVRRQLGLRYPFESPQAVESP